MKRNVLLVVLPYILDPDALVASKRVKSFKAFPYGVLSMATYLKNNASDKVNVEVLDCNLYDGNCIPVIREKLRQFKPDLVGLSMNFDISYKHLKQTTNTIKEYNAETVIILGGSAATAAYDIILKEQNNIDGICYYEGEIPLLELVSSDDMITFLENNVSWITKKSLRDGRVPQKTSVIDLDEVINIDYDFVDISKYGMREAFSPFAGKRKKGKQFFLITSRGCPYSCVFCMRSADSDKTIRYASVEAIIKHIKFLVSNNDMKILTIYDDQLLLNKKRAKQLFRELAQFNLRIECPNGLSVAFIDDEMARLMRNAGMDTIQIAIESGSPYVLNKIIHKPLNLKKVKPVVKILRKYGFWIQGFFVSGLPGETDEHRDETVRFIKDVGLDWASFSLAIPSRGSELYKICVENGYIKGEMGVNDLIHSDKFIIDTPEYSREHVIKKTFLMNLDVNFVNNYRMKNGEWKMVLPGLRSTIEREPDHAFAHYYLGKALHCLSKNDAVNSYRTFRRIIEKDNKWKEYAKHFNIY